MWTSAGRRVANPDHLARSATFCTSKSRPSQDPRSPPPQKKSIEKEDTCETNYFALTLTPTGVGLYGPQNLREACCIKMYENMFLEVLCITNKLS